MNFMSKKPSAVILRDAELSDLSKIVSALQIAIDEIGTTQDAVPDWAGFTLPIYGTGDKTGDIVVSDGIVWFECRVYE